MQSPAYSSWSQSACLPARPPACLGAACLASLPPCPPPPPQAQTNSYIESLHKRISELEAAVVAAAAKAVATPAAGSPHAPPGGWVRAGMGVPSHGAGLLNP